MTEQESPACVLALHPPLPGAYQGYAPQPYPSVRIAQRACPSFSGAEDASCSMGSRGWHSQGHGQGSAQGSGQGYVPGKGQPYGQYEGSQHKGIGGAVMAQFPTLGIEDSVLDAVPLEGCEGGMSGIPRVRQPQPYMPPEARPALPPQQWHPAQQRPVQQYAPQQSFPHQYPLQQYSQQQYTSEQYSLDSEDCSEYSPLGHLSGQPGAYRSVASPQNDGYPGSLHGEEEQGTGSCHGGSCHRGGGGGRIGGELYAPGALPNGYPLQQRLQHQVQRPWVGPTHSSMYPESQGRAADDASAAGGADEYGSSSVCPVELPAPHQGSPQERTRVKIRQRDCQPSPSRVLGPHEQNGDGATLSAVCPAEATMDSAKRAPRATRIPLSDHLSDPFRCSPDDFGKSRSVPAECPVGAKVRQAQTTRMGTHVRVPRKPLSAFDGPELTPEDFGKSSSVPPNCSAGIRVRATQSKADVQARPDGCVSRKTLTVSDNQEVSWKPPQDSCNSEIYSAECPVGAVMACKGMPANQVPAHVRIARRDHSPSQDSQELCSPEEFGRCSTYSAVCPVSSPSALKAGPKSALRIAKMDLYSEHTYDCIGDKDTRKASLPTGAQDCLSVPSGRQGGQLAGQEGLKQRESPPPVRTGAKLTLGDPYADDDSEDEEEIMHIVSSALSRKILMRLNAFSNKVMEEHKMHTTKRFEEKLSPSAPKLSPEAEKRMKKGNKEGEAPPKKAQQNRRATSPPPRGGTGGSSSASPGESSSDDSRAPQSSHIRSGPRTSSGTTLGVGAAKNMTEGSGRLQGKGPQTHLKGCLKNPRLKGKGKKRVSFSDSVSVRTFVPSCHD